MLPRDEQSEQQAMRTTGPTASAATATKDSPAPQNNPPRVSHRPPSVARASSLRINPPDDLRQTAAVAINALRQYIVAEQADQLSSPVGGNVQSIERLLAQLVRGTPETPNHHPPAMLGGTTATNTEPGQLPKIWHDSSQDHMLGTHHTPAQHARSRFGSATEGGLSAAGEDSPASQASANAQDHSKAAATPLRIPLQNQFTIPELLEPIEDCPWSLPGRLEACLADSSYWLNLVARLGYDVRVYAPDGNHGRSAPTLDTVSRYFDSTQLGMMRVFHLFDKDHDSAVTYAEIARGLKQQGLYQKQGAVAEGAFRELCALLQLKPEEDPEVQNPALVLVHGSVRPPAFLAALRNLRLAAVISAAGIANAIHPADSTVRIFVHEYREDHLFARTPLEPAAAVDFLFKPSSTAALPGINYGLLNGPPLESRSSTAFSNLSMQSTNYSGIANFRVRWVHCYEPSPTTILGLAMKYGLDPRFVLDVFTLWREQSKVDMSSAYSITYDQGGMMELGKRVSDHALWQFMVLPVLKLSSRSKATLRPWQVWRRLKLRRSIDNDKLPSQPRVDVVVDHCNLAFFVSGLDKTSETEQDCAPNSDGRGTVISFSSEWITLAKMSTIYKVDDESSAPVMDHPDNMKLSDSDRALLKDLWTSIGKGDSPPLEDPKEGSVSPSVGIGPLQPQHDEQISMFAKLMVQMRTSFSPMRTGDAHTFLLKAVNDITEDYTLVLQAYEACLMNLQKRLDKEKDQFPQKDVRRLQKVIRHMGMFYRMVRPLNSAVQAMENQTGPFRWSAEAMLYLSDIKSNLARFLDDCMALRENAKAMSDQFESHCESKASSILYVLTLVTTVFVPGQFLTSLYGMNFQDPDTGDPGIPELMWRHGYLFFWLVFISMTVATLTFYKKRKWI